MYNACTLYIYMSSYRGNAIAHAHVHTMYSMSSYRENEVTGTCFKGTRHVHVYTCMSSYRGKEVTGNCFKGTRHVHVHVVHCIYNVHVHVHTCVV